MRIALTTHDRWSAGERVLVRCQAGFNRSGLVTPLVLMLHGMSADVAIASLARRLAPQDCLGVVTFDTQADVVLPCRPMTDHHTEDVQRSIERIRPGGSTDISTGYLLALREAKSALATTGHTSATVLLISDGHANAGAGSPFNRFLGSSTLYTLEKCWTSKRSNSKTW